MKKKKNLLLVEMWYNYHFNRSDFSILDHHHHTTQKIAKKLSKLDPVR